MDVGLVIDFFRRIVGGGNAGQVVLDRGASDNITCDAFSAPCVDAVPADGDYAITMRAHGRAVVTGYADVKNAGISKKGEFRAYARDANGTPVVEIHLKQDGTGILKNQNGQIEIQQNGTVVINGVIFDTSGNITTTGIVTANDITSSGISRSFNTHVHTDSMGGSTTPPV